MPDLPRIATEVIDVTADNRMFDLGIQSHSTLSRMNLRTLTLDGGEIEIYRGYPESPDEAVTVSLTADPQLTNVYRLTVSNLGSASTPPTGSLFSAAPGTKLTLNDGGGDEFVYVVRRLNHYTMQVAPVGSLTHTGSVTAIRTALPASEKTGRLLGTSGTISGADYYETVSLSDRLHDPAAGPVVALATGSDTGLAVVEIEFLADE